MKQIFQDSNCFCVLKKHFDVRRNERNRDIGGEREEKKPDNIGTEMLTCCFIIGYVFCILTSCFVTSRVVHLCHEPYIQLLASCERDLP